MIATSELNATCTTCRRPIRDGIGHLGFDVTAARTYRQQVDEWRAKNPSDAGTLASLMEHPETPQWQAHCESCAEVDDRCGYSIQLDQLRTWKDLVHWTGHLAEKAWLVESDWHSMLSDILEGKDPRLQPAPPRSLTTDRVISFVRALTPLTEVIREQQVELKKAGDHLEGVCPFPGHGHPALYVDPTAQTWVCMAEGEGGDAITFIRKLRDCSYGEAVDELAERALNGIFTGRNTLHFQAQEATVTSSREGATFTFTCDGRTVTVEASAPLFRLLAPTIDQVTPGVGEGES